MPRKQNGQSHMITGETDNHQPESLDVVAREENFDLKFENNSFVSSGKTIDALRISANVIENSDMKKEVVHFSNAAKSVVNKQASKRKSEASLIIDSSDRMPKRGRPRKAFIFPVVVSSADTSITSTPQSTADNVGVNVGNVESGDANVNMTKVRHDSERTCHVCGKFYWKPSDLQRHLYKHTGERRFSCPICDQFFSCKRNMQYHQRAVHGLAIELSPGLDKKWKRRSYYFRAIEALKAAGGVQNLKNGAEVNGDISSNHLLSETVALESADDNIEDRLSQPKVDDAADNSITETEDDSSSCEIFVSVEDCDNCDLREFKIDSMNDEVLISRTKGVNTSSGESTFIYKCNVCEKMYLSIERLHSHFVEHFETLKPDDTYVCDKCGEMFTNRFDFKNHIQDHPVVEEYSADSDAQDDLPSLLSPETLSDMAHASLALAILEEGASNTTTEISEDGWRPGGFKCKECFKTFDRSFSLNRHLRSHTGVKKCYCHHCGKGFCEQRNLRHHIIRFHSDGSERHLLRRTRNRDSLKCDIMKQMAEEQQNQITFEQEQHSLEMYQNSTEVVPDQSKVSLQDDHFNGIGIKKEKVDDDERLTTVENNNSESDKTKKLLLTQSNCDETTGYHFESGLTSSLLGSEQENIVIKVEPPEFSEEEEEELPPSLPPSLPPMEPVVMITGTKGLSKRGRKPRKRVEDLNSITITDEVLTSNKVEDEAANQNIKKGSHISKYTPRLPIVENPERVKVIHPRRMDNGLIVFPCCYCDKVFTSTSDVHRHMNFHEDIRPYKCNQCHYYSRTKSQLKVHMMRHKGIRKYFCEPCNYYGVTQSDLNRHKKSQAHFARLAEAEENGNSNLSAVCSTPSLSKGTE
ncbi:hypothetical protein CHUAL_010463 [Chamberlinius hualienensis]